MSFPILVHQDNGHFVATLLGAPELRVTAATREIALAEMRMALQKRMAHGEIVLLDMKPDWLFEIAGKYRDDPTLQDICDEIYRERDAEPKE